MNDETTTAAALGQAPISTFVRTPLVTIASNATLRAAAQAMRHHEIGAIAIVDSGVLDGVLSEQDVARALAAGVDPDAALVGAWMSCPPLSVHPGSSVTETAIAMLHNHLRCIPVFGVHGERIGYVRLDEILVPVLHAEELPADRLPYMPPG